MNQVKVQGRIVREPYLGSGKSGSYAAGNIAVKDGAFEFWVGYYAPGEAGKAIANAQVNELYMIEGSLTENKRKDKDSGKDVRTLQIKASRITKVGAPDVPKKARSSEYISDDDRPREWDF